MFQIVILICAFDMSRSDCRPESALDVIRGPEVVSEVMCGFHGRALLAASSLAPRQGREYMKIQCVRNANRLEARQEPPAGPPDQAQSARGAIRD